VLRPLRQDRRAHQRGGPEERPSKGYERGEEPITCRPAEVLEPELEKAKEEIGDLAVDMDDLVLYAIYPVTGKKFLQWKYGKEEPPAEVKPTPWRGQGQRMRCSRKPRPANWWKRNPDAPEKGEACAPSTCSWTTSTSRWAWTKWRQPRGEIRPADGSAVGGSGRRAPAAAGSGGTCACGSRPCRPHRQSSGGRPAPAAADISGTPLNGAHARHDRQLLTRKWATRSAKGETVVVLEAMKMENALAAPASGTVKAINYASGDSVAKGDVLCVIG
jgi:pyruvate carboxylase subunit B